jgi:protein-tyrosine phosphatase
VAGGPYRQRPEYCIGVKLAKEVKADFDYKIDIEDFRTPKVADVDAAMLKVVPHILNGERVYIGCMGGRGRTGLFMACLAKAFGVEYATLYVREHYYRHAVETDAQHQFVENYEVPAEVRRMIFWARVKALFRRSGCLTGI